MIGFQLSDNDHLEHFAHSQFLGNGEAPTIE